MLLSKESLLSEVGLTGEEVVEVMRLVVLVLAAAAAPFPFVGASNQAQLQYS
ncbi:hypothetical protein AGABI1DRAFT_86364 [Agaricus bisporus var. burnettii JB137-S8]|uniref:Uncharacterized protein n=1 Tax=Agaricus bisporus var. burnettii (strain JB137-S8 / ATCC MYA-4627 / FGSC 10392) TaxID=597362 RepID=K5WQV0_AGABU|nr:uncharacterized protein AGABI1DRAFT_86364 [Agaricus bisporus var. burnettii JB137-S8]EKM77731.1 hypothetical protein AGABI1DRAFT_86364 [Agaricus bisporus var. burnettii JB137-S8]